MIEKRQLAQLVRNQCLQTRPEGYVLKSGKHSDYYLDCRTLTISSDVRIVVAQLRQNLVCDGIEFDAIGGPCVGADTVVGAFLHSTYFPWRRLDSLRGFLVRAAAKDHGLDGLVIGSVRPGDRCVVFDDVATTAGSVLRAIDAVEAFGCTVVAASVLVDRSGGEAERVLAERDVEFRPLLTIEDVLAATT